MIINANTFQVTIDNHVIYTFNANTLDEVKAKLNSYKLFITEKALIHA